MREILFRGKPKNEADYEFLKKMYKDNCKDGFIYGSLVISHGKYYICIMALCQINSLVDNGNTTMFEVIPETVGEYTCLKDKNDKKIFEGDIIKYKNTDGIKFNGVALTVIGKVVYNEKNASFAISGKDEIGAKHYDYFPIKNIEVIGNIFDNPEILKG